MRCFSLFRFWSENPCSQIDGHCPLSVFSPLVCVSLLAGFLALGGWLPSWLWLLPLGAVFLIVGFLLVGVDLGLTVWRAPRWDAAARLVLVGLLSMGATVAFGGTFAFELGGWAKSAPAALAILNDGVPLHAIAGLGGWLTLTAMGVSYRLLSMFMLSPDVDDRKSRMTVFAGAGTIAIALAGGLAAIAASAGLSIVLSLAGISGLATLALYTRDLVKLYRNRKRGALELNTRMAVHSFACLAGAALLGVTLAAMGSFADHAGAFVFLVAFGWLSGLVLAKLYKIVAFLTWLETYGPVMGRVPTPRVQDLVAERRANKWFAAYFACSLDCHGAASRKPTDRVPYRGGCDDGRDHRYSPGTDPDAKARRRGRAAASAEGRNSAATAVFPKLSPSRRGKKS